VTQQKKTFFGGSKVKGDSGLVKFGPRATSRFLKRVWCPADKCPRRGSDKYRKKRGEKWGGFHRTPSQNEGEKRKETTTEKNSIGITNRSLAEMVTKIWMKGNGETVIVKKQARLFKKRKRRGRSLKRRR